MVERAPYVEMVAVGLVFGLHVGGYGETWEALLGLHRDHELAWFVRRPDGTLTVDTEVAHELANVLVALAPDCRCREEHVLAFPAAPRTTDGPCEAILDLARGVRAAFGGGDGGGARLDEMRARYPRGWTKARRA